MPGRLARRATDPTDVSYVRPHELEIVATPSDGTIAVTLSQVLTLGAQARIEFRRDDDGSYLDVEMPRSEFARSEATRSASARGSRVHLKPRRVTRSRDRAARARSELDPAAMI